MPRVPDDGQIELTRGDLLAALVKVNDAIDDALDELGRRNVVERQLVKVRLHALVTLRRTIRRRIDQTRR